MLNVVDPCFSQDAQMTREDVGALWRLADADGKIHRVSKIGQIQSAKNVKIKRIQRNNQTTGHTLDTTGGGIMPRAVSCK